MARRKTRENLANSPEAMPPEPASTAPKAVPDLGLAGFVSPADEGGLSLDDLGQAFAELMNAETEVPYEPEGGETGALASVAEGVDPAPLPAASDEACELCPRTIVEALLFVGQAENRPLTSDEVSALMRGVRPQEIDEVIRELNEAYEAEGRAFRINSVGSGYRLELREEFGAVRDRLYGRLREARLSQAGVDILAIVAYNQPVSRAKIDELRGQSSGAVLNQLVRRQLLAVELDEQNPKLVNYRTTQRFLEVFGLESLADLPQTQEI